MLHPTALVPPLVLALTLAPPAQNGVQEVKPDVGVVDVKPQPAEPSPEGNAWFDKVRLDLGTFFDDEKATGKFAFRNPTDVEQKLSNVIGSCACTRAEFTIGDRLYVLDREPVANTLYRVTRKEGAEVKERVSHITIGPRETGELVVHMDMHNVRGVKEATLDMETSDPGTPHVKLSWKATGAIFFEVSPPDVHLNEMNWNDQREFQFEISSPIQEDFNITGHEPLGQGVTLTSTEKVMR
ncbi:MAG TPA: hypothetical protein VK081_01155, partial [Planctomycetota bacterium]|nr:hypothetical protein [Planctomycetota bacterium]